MLLLVVEAVEVVDEGESLLLSIGEEREARGVSRLIRPPLRGFMETEDQLVLWVV